MDVDVNAQPTLPYFPRPIKTYEAGNVKDALYPYTAGLTCCEIPLGNAIDDRP